MYLLQSFSICFSLLPALVDAKERCDSIHPLDEPRACPKRNHSVVLGNVQLCVVSARDRDTYMTFKESCYNS